MLAQYLTYMIGYAILTIFPGMLILKILKLDKMETVKKIVLSIGISIAFIMLFGLFINELYYYIGYVTPLSKNSLIISFSVSMVLLYVIGLKINKGNMFIISNFEFHLSRKEKLFLVIPIFFPSLSIFGTYVMNVTGGNIILESLLLLIIVYIISVCVFNQTFPQRLYPMIIFSISISLLLLLALRSNYIIGTDTHFEYYTFVETLDNLRWKISGDTPLDAVISISILPTIYQSILGIHTDFLFKILYSSIYSITPIVVYILSKRYVKEFYAFLSSCFFMFQSIFLNTEANSRTSVAIFFFALTMMILFSDEIATIKKNILIIMFVASVVISHYSTAYIFFFIMSGTFVGLEILKYCNKNFRHIINLEMVSLFSILLFFWYSQVIDVVFNSGIHFIVGTVNSFHTLFLAESRHESMQTILGKNLGNGIPYDIQWISTWATFIFVCIGMVNVCISKIRSKKLNVLKDTFDTEHFLVASFCSLLLVVSIVLPNISQGYGMDRLYGVTTIILSIFFVVGGVAISTFVKTKEYIVMLLVLIPYFLSISGVTYDMFGIHQSIVLNSDGDLYDKLYIHDQESYGAKWLENNKYKETTVLSDNYGTHRLVSQGHIMSAAYDKQLIEGNMTIKDEYLYLRYTSVVNKKFLDSDNIWHDITRGVFYENYKVYSNGGSDVWKGPG